MSTYSRSSIIALLKESLQQLRNLSINFRPYELGDSFTIRLNMMKCLASLAFNYSIKISYLDECMEYADIAEILDDVLLQMRRCDIRYRSSTYGYLVAREYENMQDALDLFYERIKTIRVVCVNRHYRRVSKNSLFARSEDETLKNRYSERQNIRNDGNSITDENNETTDSRFSKFSEIINTHLKAVIYNNEPTTDENFILQCRDEPIPDEHFILQCKDITGLFTLFIENVEYISYNPRFRMYRKDGNYSFMQVCIRKCIQIYNELSIKYANIIGNSKDPKPELFAAKKEAMTAIQEAEHILCKYYTENPVENETAEDLIANYLFEHV